MKKIPTTTKAMSGSSLPTVSTFKTRLLCRMPLMLMAAIVTMIAAMKRGARPAGPERRHVESEGGGEDVDHGGPARRAREPQHPADFERGKAAERRARVEVGAAGAIEPAARPRQTTAR